MDSSNLPGYEIARQEAAFFPHPEPGYLRIHGADQSSFLQRQTTNDVKLLEPKKTVLTVLTSPTARILDVLYLLNEADAIGVLTLPGRGAQTARFFKSRIFFMDKVTVADASADFIQVDVLGPRAPGALNRLGLDYIPDVGEVISAQIGTAEVRALGLDPSFALGYRLLAAAKAKEFVEAALQEAGVPRLSRESYDCLRVESGLPAAGHELTEDYTPHEASLKVAISEDKGCYTGQEIIARQITYDKVTQHLCGLRLSSPAVQGERVWVDGKAIGTVTSTAASPHLGPIALAILKRPYHQPGTRLSVGVEREAGATAVVSPLPFS